MAVISPDKNDFLASIMISKKSLPSSDYAEAWLDKCSAAFFKRYPKGQGVEVRSGLSTRFHRLSVKTEWPRFSWSMVDYPEITAKARAEFPNTEHLSISSCARPTDCWTEHVKWEAPTAKLIMIGEEEPVQSVESLNRSANGYKKARFAVDFLLHCANAKVVEALDSSLFSVVEAKELYTQRAHKTVVGRWVSQFKGSQTVLAHVRVIPQLP